MISLASFELSLDVFETATGLCAQCTTTQRLFRHDPLLPRQFFRKPLATFHLSLQWLGQFFVTEFVQLAQVVDQILQLCRTYSRLTMAAIGTLVFCTDCGNLLPATKGTQRNVLHCECCGAENRGLYAWCDIWQDL